MQSTRRIGELFTCQLVLVAAAPVLQDFHAGENGGGMPPVATPLRPFVVSLKELRLRITQCCGFQNYVPVFLEGDVLLSLSDD